MPKESFLMNRIKSVGFAIRGAILLIRTEASMKIQVCPGPIMTAAGLYFDTSATEWIMQLFAIALVLCTVGMNTAVAKLSDLVQPEFDEKIGLIKDITAGAVMLVSIVASIIGFIIYFPKIF